MKKDLINVVLAGVFTLTSFCSQAESSLSKSDIDIGLVSARIGVLELGVTPSVLGNYVKEVNKKNGAIMPFYKYKISTADDFVAEIISAKNRLIEKGEKVESATRKTIINLLNSSPQKYTKQIISSPKKDGLTKKKQIIRKRMNGDLYIKIPEFNEKACNTKFELAGAKNVVLDLSNNKGGSVECSINIAKQFVGKREKYTTINYNNKVEDIYIDGIGVSDYESFSVIVDGNTASSAELLTRFLLRNGAQAYGEPSFGKNTVQGYYHDGMVNYTITIGYLTDPLCDSLGCKIYPKRLSKLKILDSFNFIQN